jgi:hypothetical protein
LTAEKDYVNFSKKVGKVLYEGQAPYRIPSFFKELFRDLGRYCDAEEVKDMLDSLTAQYNEKIRQ